MRAPAFWGLPHRTLPARLLAPVGAAYGAVAARRMAQPPHATVAVPVICVGNFTLGGAGKTPAALALLARLQALRPFALTRGHGGRLAGPLRVDAAVHGPGEVGDEAFLLARAAPTILSRDRPAGAALALQQGAGAIVMDDGLQNPSLAKTLAFAVLDGPAGLGNGLTFPAGPLRAPLDAQWPWVHALVIVGDGAASRSIVDEAGRRGLPVLRGRLAPEPGIAATLRGRRVLAFAGIGRPAKFYDTLAALGAVVAATRSFPDHHAYTGRDLAALSRHAKDEGLALVTTEKDAVKLPADFAAEVETLPVRLVFEDETALDALLADALPGFRPPPPR